jgi:hypothetical protein
MALHSYHSCIRNIYIIILQKWHDTILACWVTILVHERDRAKPSILTWIYCSFPDWAQYTVVVSLNKTSHSASWWNTTMVTTLQYLYLNTSKRLKLQYLCFIEQKWKLVAVSQNTHIIRCTKKLRLQWYKKVIFTKNSSYHGCILRRR